MKMILKNAKIIKENNIQRYYKIPWEIWIV